MDNLMALTKEMGSVIETNDLESLGAVLSMRQETMERIDNIHTEIVNTVKSLDKPDMDRLKQLLQQKDDPPVNRDDPHESGIFDTNRMTLLLLKKIIELDGTICDNFKKRDKDKGE